VVSKALIISYQALEPFFYPLTSVPFILRAYLLEEYPLQAEQLRHDMLFVNLEGKYIGQPVSIARFNGLFQQLHTRTGIKSHPHLFRHTFATRMLQQGYLDHYVQQILGHRSITTTKNIYSHVLDEMNLDDIINSEDDR
jgi:integrase/recombinase XerD